MRKEEDVEKLDKTEQKQDDPLKRVEKSEIPRSSKDRSAKRRLQLDEVLPSHGSPRCKDSSDGSLPDYHSDNYMPSDVPCDDSSHNQTDQTDPTAETLEDQIVAKEIERCSIAKVIEAKPLLDWFLNHLLPVEGGRRGEKPSRESQWQVG